MLPYLLLSACASTNYFIGETKTASGGLVGRVSVEAGKQSGKMIRTFHVAVALKEYETAHQLLCKKFRDNYSVAQLKTDFENFDKTYGKETNFNVIPHPLAEDITDSSFDRSLDDSMSYYDSIHAKYQSKRAGSNLLFDFGVGKDAGGSVGINYIKGYESGSDQAIFAKDYIRSCK